MFVIYDFSRYVSIQIIGRNDEASLHARYKRNKNNKIYLLLLNFDKTPKR